MDLQAVRIGDLIIKIRGSAELTQFAQLLYILKAATEPLEPLSQETLLANWEKQMMKIPSALRPRTFHQALGVSCPDDPRHRAGPPPTAVLNLLKHFKTSGGDVAALADETLHGRMAAGIEDSTGITYYSHINMLEWACSIFDCPIVPAGLHHIRRVALVCNSPSTLRGWLAAWRRLHLQRGSPWEGDSDAVLKAIRIGTLRAAPAGPPNRRVRRQLLRKLLHAAIRSERYWIGAMLNIGYIFALRMPSELLRQGKRPQFQMGSKTIRIINLKRKQKRSLCELARWCTCQTDPVLCPHPWLAYAFKRTTSEALFDVSPTRFRMEFHALLKEVGVPETDIPGYTSHSLRRGAAVDILEQHGLQAMLAHGDWASPQAASHYATFDEMDRHALGRLAADLSEDDT